MTDQSPHSGEDKNVVFTDKLNLAAVDAAITQAWYEATNHRAEIAGTITARMPDFPVLSDCEQAARANGLPANHKPLISTKTYGHDAGFSCTFRQWRAHSHCRFLHGYSLGFKFTFAASSVDNCGWVVDFGGLKPLKQILADTFDHKLLVAQDDPWMPFLRTMIGDLPSMYNDGVLSDAPGMSPCADVIIVPATGCEAFARMVYDVTEQWLKDAGFSPRVWLVSVEVSEHGGNSAICQG